MWLYLILTKQSGDIQHKPGPKSNSCRSFSICHWNVNIISVYNFIITSLLKSYQKLILTPVFQRQDGFEVFANNIELNIDTATANDNFLTVVLGDVNDKSNLWFKGDKTKVWRL